MPNDISDINITTDNSTEKPQPWHRQSWDCDASYRAFHDFYLQLHPGERSVDEAYRRFKKANGKQIDSKKRAPLSWMCWSQGKIWNGTYQTGKSGNPTWSDRAKAYDDHIRRQIEEEDAKRKIKEDLEFKATARKIKIEYLNQMLGVQYKIKSTKEAKCMTSTITELQELENGERMTQPLRDTLENRMRRSLETVNKEVDEIACKL